MKIRAGVADFRKKNFSSRKGAKTQIDKTLRLCVSAREKIKAAMKDARHPKFTRI